VVPRKQEPEMRSKRPRPREKTIMIEERYTTDLPTAVGPSSSEPKQLSWSRLDHLCSITKLLVNFESADDTLSAVLAMVSNTLPLRSTVLIDEIDDQAQVSVWKAPGVSEEALQTARNHAATAYAYLAGSRSISGKNAHFAREKLVDFRLEKTSRGGENFIVIPLVVNRSVYGVLQLECTTVFNESDLAFVNAIANQFAIALDRHKAKHRELDARVEAEAAERRMAFLAESRRLLASTLDYQAAWTNMGQLVISRIADICIIDIMESDRWSADRICVLSPAAKELVTAREAASALANTMSTVLKTGASCVYPDPVALSLKSNAARAGVQESAASADFIKSYACVPLLFEGMTIGSLTVARTRSVTIYGDVDLSILHDLGICLVMSFNRARLYRTAVEAIRNRDGLLGIVAHDLRAPLTVIMGFTNVFLTNGRPGERLSCDPEHIGAIHRAATQMNRLIEDLLSTASIEAKHVLIERHLNAVGPLINEALERMRPLTSASKIELRSELLDYISPILVDRERIMQVFTNLIDNAIKFSPRASVITVKVEQSGNEVQFSVEDSGPGIAEDQLPHIFDRFWQVPGTGKKGTGLGLFIVKGIVEAHGGRVWAEKNVGVGTTFRFTVPAGKSDINPFTLGE